MITREEGQQALLGVQALDLGDYAMTVSLFKRALEELNRTLDLQRVVDLTIDNAMRESNADSGVLAVISREPLSFTAEQQAIAKLLERQDLSRREMAAVMTVVRLGRLLRSEHDLKVRQPLAEMHVVSRNAALLAYQDCQQALKEFLNVDPEEATTAIYRKILESTGRSREARSRG